MAFCHRFFFLQNKKKVFRERCIFIFFMKKSSLLLAGVIASMPAVAGAKDFSDKIYGKANVNFAYTLQVYDEDYTKPTAETGHAFSFGGGYNVFYKLHNFVHPFAGAELVFRLPLNGYGDTIDYKEFMMFHFKFGAKLNVVKDISVLPYYILGFNVAQYKFNDEDETTTETSASLSTGLGFDVLYQEKYSVGFEWRYSEFYKKIDGGKIDAFHAHNISFKVGYYFL